MKEEEIDEVFRDMRAEPVPADSLVRMRSGLEARITRHARWRMTVWAITAVAITLIAILWPPVAPVQESPRTVATLHQPEAQSPPPVGARRPTVRRVVHRAPRTRPLLSPEAPVMIQIETADPEVVIRFIGE